MLALYRKYRPKNLSDLVGHELNVEILKNAARLDRLSHAYLFHGSRGTGKTTTARLLAKLANCSKRHSNPKFKELGEPCNECAVCQSIDAGRAMDIVEIDAASNRGIDEIRSLQEGIKLSPTSLPRKVFIIDEVHMLTTPAFNALLKTLEEPPAHALFILATTEIAKVPATIASRTQKFVFKKLPRNLILQKLNTVVAAEKITIDPAALELVATVADGSLRDAESLLDQVVSFLGVGGITLSKVEQIIGAAGTSRLADLTAAILAKDIDKALSQTAALKEQGYDLVQFNQDLIDYLSKVVTLSANPKIESVFSQELSAEELAQLKSNSSLAGLPAQIALLKSLIAAHREMRYSPFAHIPLEVALVEFIKR